ncbi:hypothetical protein I7044_002653 [Salmonella enterica subsp. enterica]|nr:hypothetical protein [Salmonella enterica subsp. enterica]EGR9488214.1 hypothetical protein [Salmonella enterica subsp. enterica]
MEGAEKEKLFLRFKRLLAGFVDQKLPRFACPLPNSRQQKTGGNSGESVLQHQYF